MKIYVIITVLYHLVTITRQKDEDYDYADVKRVKKGTPLKAEKNEQYLKEIQHGDMADLLSTNIHANVPPTFKDFGRRFYQQHQASSSQVDKEAEERMDKIIKQAIKENPHLVLDKDEERLRPVKASADIVLALAKQSKLNQRLQPNEQPEVDRKALRSGDYWNSFWVEDVPNPQLSLRSGRSLESIKVDIKPGSKLYKLVSMTKEFSPKLLYIINSKDDDGDSDDDDSDNSDK